MEKIKFIFFTFFFSIVIHGQNVKIDSTNYCNFYDMDTHNKNSEIKTYRLTETMIIDIVYDEMIKSGYKWVGKFRILKIDPNKYIASVCYSDKSNCGFLIENIIDSSPSQKNRNTVSLTKETSGFDYIEKIVSADGSHEFIKIKEIPKNLHILKMDNYWYQTSSNQEKNKNLVSKDFILELLRNDVRSFLKQFKS